jgi:hypothetical protein
MQPARPLHDVFDELARGDLGAGPAGALADSGHGDLPDQLVSEAIVNYADTAPIEVAEHLAPFVKVHSGMPADPDTGELPAGDGLELLATAPQQIVSDEDGAYEADLLEPPAGAGDLSYGADPADLDFAFGSGAEAGTGVPAIDEPEQDLGAVVEPGPAGELAPPPAEVESAAEPVGPWAATPDAEEAADDEADGTVDG